MNHIEGNKLIHESPFGRKARFKIIPDYDSEWNELMLVVEKICDYDNQLGYEHRVDVNYTSLEIWSTSILCHKKAVYERVVQFIQWYNNQNQTV
jgi:hypothetical protein